MDRSLGGLAHALNDWNPCTFLRDRHKPLAMRLMRTVNPLSSFLPWMTQNMRPTALTARLYDFFVVLVMAIQGCVFGSTIDLIRFLRRRKGY